MYKATSSNIDCIATCVSSYLNLVRVCKQIQNCAVLCEKDDKNDVCERGVLIYM